MKDLKGLILILIVAALLIIGLPIAGAIFDHR